MAAPPDEIALRVEDLVKEFPNKRVLSGVNFEAKRGEVLVLMGGSGAGKSTIFNCIIGTEPITSGHVWINGVDITQLQCEEDYDQIRRHYGVAFQNGALFNSMTIGENVALPLRYNTELDEETIRVMVKVKLEQVGLRDSENLLPSQLSGGMQKRAAFARAMALDPCMVFFDEPSAGLDPIAIALLDELIISFSKKMGLTCVIITHELASAFRIADRIILLHQGQIYREGTPQDIRASDDPLIQQFIRGQPHGPFDAKTDKSDYIEDILGA